VERGEGGVLKRPVARLEECYSLATLTSMGDRFEPDSEG